MSEESGQEISNESNGNESNEQINEQSSQDLQQSNEGTQHDSTSQQADASNEIQSNGSELGLSKKQEEESSESSESFSESLDTLVNLALNGGLSDEQRQALEDQGISGHFDMIVNGHKAQIAKNDEEIISVVGSKESYAELQEWAGSNLSDSEVESFNRAVLESNDIGLAKLAVEGLQARYLKANGSAPNKVIEAGGTSNAANRPYDSRDEYINETMSMKYRQDPEYAALVEAKRNLSGF
jgi:hypothetical protein